MSAVLELKGVTRVHGQGAAEVHALRGISFTAYAGELVAVMGPSGSGKSTLLTLAGGLDTPTAGTVSIEGRDLGGLGRTERARLRRSSIGYVFQDFNLIPALTAAENVALPRELDGERPRAAKKLARAVLEEVGIGDLADRFPDEMSGGQQQRIAIARSLVLEPRLLLFDEPLSNLDFKLRIQMRYELRNLQRRLGKTSIYVTHDQTEALALSDRIAVLSHGRIEQVGRPREIYESPRTAFVADFIGNSNLIAATIAQSASTHAVARTEGGLRLELPPGAGNAAGERVTLLVRPERVRVRPPGEREPEGRNRVAASVEDATYLGEDVHVRVIAAEGGLALLASLKSDRFARDLRPGASVEIAIRPDDIHVLRE
jgi:ABC-type Fe3+/spermidine/putrescine transport system ATPase subunit